ncbi:MAG: hypothetical protein K9I94_02020 [Bacteroidales bacterium]|nr:hypothetical protein [Bacteroidales bacterium]
MERIIEKINKHVQEVEILEKRFEFINDKGLRSNLAISFQYITFLLTLQEEINLQGPLNYSISKNIVLNLASIVEGILHHTLKRLLDNSLLDYGKVMGFEKTYTNKKVLFKTDDGKEICGIHLHKKLIKLKAGTNFQDISRACKRGKIIDDKLFSEIEELRKMRNRIHLAGLRYVDDFYDKNDIEHFLNITKQITDLAEEKIAEAD